ncbi:DUF6607 family protein [Salinisphaera sp. P385]|uniref:DUF6607 family protein n=1 Tax=Spectribacter acetivorans TaxID=3075603 RepID=A0ABU3B5V9_9GAMM|nr:DUF6607 family protein [Salinisphaera sp. P385]MDT0617832.1 DUF6607 family protein [Salinisphaera sp. P385]
MRIPGCCLLFVCCLPMAAFAEGYVFSYGFDGADAPEPRGGTTRGAPVDMAAAPDPRFDAVRAADLTAKQRDRRAILALAGEFKTTFEFVETATLVPDLARDDQPYRSWATEYVFVLEDSPDRIRLQHVLVMRFVDDDGDISDPMVTKHWRQDWHWQPERIWRYQGDRRWVSEPVDDPEGVWKQAVYQVDDAPRYEALGRWQHEAGASYWQSDSFARPLPRREHSVRDDYDILAGRHRITLTPTGWLHAQENHKLRRDDNGDRQAIAAETGLNRYQRIEGFDMTPGRELWDRQSAVWAAIRAEWRRLQQQHEVLEIRREVDGQSRFARLFGLAEEIAEADDETIARRVRDAIRPYITPGD